MTLSKFSINRKITLVMLYLIIVGFGIFSITQLKIDFAPDLDFPIIIVYTSYSGASPEDIENLVSRRIEEAVSATENVKKVTSQSSEGSSLVLLEFEWGTNMKQAENDVRKNLDLIRDFLPADASEPIVIALNPSLLPVMFISLNSPSLGPAELKRISEDRIEPLLERVEGVASVTTRGGLKRQINVKLDQIMLAAHKLTPEDVATAIQIGAGLTSSGSIKTLTKEYNLRVFSEYKSIDQLKNIVVRRTGGKIVHLKDVAEVEDGFQEQTSDVRINKNQGIAIIVSKQSDANTVRTVKNIYKMLPKIREILPEDCELNVVFDSAEFTQKSIENLVNTAILSFLFAVGVIYFFLRNWRGSTIMAISMPISVIATFGVLKLANLTLNIVSMAGLALAIGMLVDNSIVVLENIFRHRELGEDKIKSAEIGASEVGMAITASTLTTIAVFLPVLFVPGITSRLFRDMVLTISFSLGVSLLVALTLVPMMSSTLLTNGNEKNNFIKKKNIINQFFGNLTKRYKSLLTWTIHHKKIVIASVILLFIASIAIFPLLGGEFMPKTDESRIQFTIETAAGSSINSLRQIVMECEKIIKEEVPEVKNMLFRFGAEETWRGNASSANTIKATIRLVPIEERKRSQFEIQDVIRKRLDNLPGIRYYFEGSGGPMSMAESDIEVKIIGHDLTIAQNIAETIKEKMKKISGFVDVKTNLKENVPQLVVHLNQDLINEYGLSYLQVARIISTAIHGRIASRYREGGDEYDIYVQLDKKYRNKRESLEELIIPLPTGGSVPLKQIAKIEETLGPHTIYRENQERYVSVSCNLSKKDLASATADVKKILSETMIPSDFIVLIGGAAEDRQEANFYLMIAFVVAVILVYMIMASQFESLVDPFIIMFTVPFALVGVVFFLFLTKTSISVMVLVGVVMLAGIAVNNGIVLVDYMNQLRHKGIALYEAAIEGGVTRLRPVLMTALTTIFGMIPLALKLGSGAEMWMPLARTVIGGLIMTSFLTLIVVPVLYILFEEFGDKVKKLILKK